MQSEDTNIGGEIWREWRYIAGGHDISRALSRARAINFSSVDETSTGGIRAKCKRRILKYLLDNCPRAVRRL